MPRAPLLISLPHGLDLGGVTSWAVRLANGLASRGRAVAIIAHPRSANQPAARINLHPGVLLVAPGHWPHMGEAQGDLSPFLPVYRQVIDLLSRAAYGPFPGPVVISPNILGDCYGVSAALCTTQPESLRVLAWQHADSDYDTSILRRYEPVISRFVAIDDRYVKSLGALFPGREADISTIPHGVEVPASPPRPRGPLPGRPLRLVYTGRMEHQQKRIGALPLLSDELSRRGIDHRITLVGDGPAAAEVDALLASRPRVQRVPNADAGQVAAFLQQADAFILASRFEGLCISRIEAMAHGCVPIITAANSGATSGLRHHHSAIFVPTRPTDDEPTAAADLASGIENFLNLDRDALAHAAWLAAREHFSIEHHVGRVAAVIDSAARDTPRWWRADWPSAFSSSRTEPGRSGSTGPDAPARLAALLASLAGRTIVLHGAGRHTLELAAVLAASPARIVALCDDDRQRWGSTFLGWPVINPADAATAGATDVVISSYIHHDSIMNRRAEYERQGLRVHPLYGPAPAAALPARAAQQTTLAASI